MELAFGKQWQQQSNVWIRIYCGGFLFFIFFLQGDIKHHRNVCVCVCVCRHFKTKSIYIIAGALSLSGHFLCVLMVITTAACWLPSALSLSLTCFHFYWFLFRFLFSMKQKLFAVFTYLSIFLFSLISSLFWCLCNVYWIIIDSVIFFSLFARSLAFRG